MTVEDINNITFERVVRGYRTQDVDDFLAKVARDIDSLKLERDTALAEKDAVVAEKSSAHEAAEKKLYILAEKIEQYRADEENLKIALLNAQRLGESVVQEARQKAEKIVKDANAAANKVYDDLKHMQAAEEHRLMHMRTDVSKFRAEVLNLYKNHIELLNNIPSYEEMAANDAANAQAAQAAAVQAAQAQAQNAGAAQTVASEESSAPEVQNEQPSADNQDLYAAEAVEIVADQNITEDTANGEVPQPQDDEPASAPAQPKEQSTFEQYVGIRFDK